MQKNFKRNLFATACLALALPIAACNDSNDGGDGMTPAPPPPPPPATGTSFDVTPCLTQEVADGVTVASLVVPDTIKIDPTMAAGFPNGRVPGDPVINRILSVLFLDLDTHPATTFENFDGGEGLNNNMNDLPLPATFPYLAPPQGQATYNMSAGGSGFDFRGDNQAAYTRVDRMGQPAVSTALVRSENKTEFNDDSPRDDLMGGDFGKWGGEFAIVLTAYTNALADDLEGLGLTLCAVPDS